MVAGATKSLLAPVIPPPPPAIGDPSTLAVSGSFTVSPLGADGTPSGAPLHTPPLNSSPSLPSSLQAAKAGPSLAVSPPDSGRPPVVKVPNLSLHHTPAGAHATPTQPHVFTSPLTGSLPPSLGSRVATPAGSGGGDRSSHGGFTQPATLAASINSGMSSPRGGTAGSVAAVSGTATPMQSNLSFFSGADTHGLLRAPPTTVSAADVVAPGELPNFLQLPSPVYCAEWVDARHVVIGAGGGGRRFGMANVLVLLAIDTAERGAAAAGGAARPPPPASSTSRPPAATPQPAPAVSLTSEQQKAVTAAAAANRGAGGPAPSTVPPLWRFVSAVDLEGDIPWCLSRYLPTNGEFALPSHGGGGDAENDKNTAEKPTATNTAMGAVSSPSSPSSTSLVSLNTPPVLRGLMGLLAVSSVAAFNVIGVRRVLVVNAQGRMGSRLCLQRFARIIVPNDTANPDKKPIALVHHVLAVAHDHNGILLYDLASLMPRALDEKGQVVPVTAAIPLASWSLPARVNDLHANRINLVHAKPARGPRGRSNSRPARGTRSRSAAGSTAAKRNGDAGGSDSLFTTPMKAERKIRGRSAASRRVDGAEKDGKDAEETNAELEEKPSAVTALVLDYVLIAALVQDKTVRLGSLRLRRRFKDSRDGASQEKEKKGEDDEDEDAAAGTASADGDITARFRVQEDVVLTATDCGLPFHLMKSSLRLVRLFGMENVPAVAVESAHRTLTKSFLLHRQAALAAETAGEVPAPMRPTVLAGMLLVAYDPAGNHSFFVRGAIEASLRAPPSSGKGSRGGTNRYGSLRLSVQLDPVSEPVIKDAITSLSVRHDTNVDEIDRLDENEFGAAVPEHWVVGTVDGWIASVRYVPHPPPDKHHHHRQPAATKAASSSSSSGAPQASAGAAPPPLYVIDGRRPTANRRQLKEYPALHKEPVSCVAVSAWNDVVSADIAQKVAVTTLPFIMLTTAPAATATGGSGGGDGKASSSSSDGNAVSPRMVRRIKRAGLELLPEKKPGWFARGQLGRSDASTKQVVTIVLFVVLASVVTFVSSIIYLFQNS